MVNKNINGCIIYLDFSPSKGHEQGKARPALVINGNSFSKYCNMTWVVPISHAVDYPLHIDLPKEAKTTGKVLCEHIKSVDLSVRDFKVLERLGDTEEGKEFVDKIKRICCNCMME